jgi:hypothetical protein
LPKFDDIVLADDRRLLGDDPPVAESDDRVDRDSVGRQDVHQRLTGGGFQGFRSADFGIEDDMSHDFLLAQICA